MTRSELEHILRAAAAITGADQFVVIGSQAILGQFPDAPAPLTTSKEADVSSLRGTRRSGARARCASGESRVDTMSAWPRLSASI